MTGRCAAMASDARAGAGPGAICSVDPATVPSVLAGWLAAHERFGRLERSALFQPAIDLAEQGWPEDLVHYERYHGTNDK